jgi:hypothetical protein
MKVIGAGFGRTGTSSLKASLETLGYPCYHMQEVINGYKRGDVQRWDDLLRGQSGMDFRNLLEGFEATVDFPTCMYFRELLELFPDSKVILSTRDPDKWFASFDRIVRMTSKTRVFSFIPMFKAVGDMNDHMIEHIFGGPVERDRCIEAYERHIVAVKAEVPPERLLVYSVTEGWEPLCEFLGKPVPREAFPHANADLADVKGTIKDQLWGQTLGRVFSRGGE